MSENRQAYLKRYYEANKATYAARDRKWSSKNRSKRVGYTLKARAKNPSKYSEYMKGYGPKYRAKNGEKVRAYNRDYSKAHYKKNKFYYFLKDQKRRAAIAKATVNIRSIEHFVKRIKARKWCVCYYCQADVLSSEIHFDHMIPIAGGGQHSVENLCVACERCNKSKSSKPVRSWITTGQLLLEV